MTAAAPATGPTGPTGPEAELDIDEALVGQLLDRQFPDLASLPRRVVANGWDNAMVRLGDDLVVRLPRRRVAAELIEHEQRCLPPLAAALPLPTPVPVRTGTPEDELFPWAWSVLPWMEGTVASAVDATTIDGAAETLAGFLTALHRPAPDDAPSNPVRGVPLATARERVAARLVSIGRADLTATWHALVDTPAWDAPAVWLHGDLHPGNLLVDGGRLVAVIDFGDITAGDPATDLVSAWMWLDDRQRVVLHDTLAVDEHTRRRGAGWALAISTAVLAGGGDPHLVAAAKRGVAAVSGEFAGGHAERGE